MNLVRKFVLSMLFFAAAGVQALDVEAPSKVYSPLLEEKHVELRWTCVYDECELQKVDGSREVLEVSDDKNGSYVTSLPEGRHDFRVLGCTLNYARWGSYRAHCEPGPIKTVRVVKSYRDDAVFRMNFDSWNNRSLFSGEENIGYVKIGEGADSPNYVMRASYEPSDNGSKRLLETFHITEHLKSATLSYDVKFQRGFEFVKGGKLHGLSRGSGYSGCDSSPPEEGWSVRVIWNYAGAPKLYIYDQDRAPGECGRGFGGDGSVVFEKGRWHRVDLYVHLNSSENSHDGVAQLYLDGKEVRSVGSLKLTGDLDVLIQHMSFNTFHGGGTPSWSPSKTVYAKFDNFSVYPGKRVTGLSGIQCESDSNGIFHKSGACCESSCGGCGGDNCAGLTGGPDSCCPSSILDNAGFCDYGDKSAPCYYDP